MDLCSVGISRIKFKIRKKLNKQNPGDEMWPEEINKIIE